MRSTTKFKQLPLLFIRICLGLFVVLLTTHKVLAQENALTFDGTNEYATLPNISETGSFTVEWWVNPNTHSQWNQMMQAGNGWDSFMFHSTNNGEVYVGTEYASRMTPTELPAGTVQLNTWQHFAYSFDGTNARFYKDGVLLATKATIASLAWNGFIIGSADAANTINGEIDELRIWNDVRTGAEIAANMCDIPTYASEANLVSYYKFNQASGSTTLTDLKGGNNGVLMNLEPASDWVLGTCRPMSYTASNVVQTNFIQTLISSTNQEIIGVNVQTNGSQTPLNLTQLVINTAGSSNPAVDIANIKVYYTGSSAAFAATNLYATVASANAFTSINVNGSQTLVEGDNYFWIAYDIAPGATALNDVDGECTALTVSDGLGAKTPAPTTVFGVRQILAAPPSPGGVGGLTVWLKANKSVYSNAGTIAAVEGSTIQQWDELSGFGSFTNLSQPIALRRPIYRTAVHNYNPAVSTEDLLAPHMMTSATLTKTDLSTSGNLTFYTLFTQTAGAVAHVWNANANSKYGFQNNIVFCQGDFFPSSIINLGSAVVPVVRAVEQTNANGVANGYSNNNLMGTVDNDGLTIGNYFEPYSLGALSNSTASGTAKTSEIIYFDGVHSLQDRTKVSSYLAVKYGTTLSNTGGGAAGDYLATDNTVIWDASFSPSHHNNIIGIGKDDSEELDQKQSHTISDDTRIYIDNLATTNQGNTGAFSANLSYVLMGDDQKQMCATPAALAEMPAGCGLYSRLEREWKVTKTNLDQDFNCDFTLDACANPGSVDVSHLRLLIDDDGDFSNGGTSCYYNGDGSDIVISYANPVITIKKISDTHLPYNGTRFMTIGSINSATPLPVDFTAFNATCKDNFVALDWKTESETNNDYFTLEKSIDGVSFNTVTTIKARGHSNTTANYTLADKDRLPGVTYYRLSQTDIDGTTKILSTRSVECNIPMLMIYPNPFNNQFVVESEFAGSLSLRDVMGKIVFQENYKAGKTTFSVENLADGVFFVEFKNENGTTKEMKLVKY